MLDTEKQLRIHTRNTSLTLVREVLRGPDGCLFEAIADKEDPYVSRSRFMVFVPSPDFVRPYIERLQLLERLTYHGWMVPDSVDRDPRMGLVAVYRIEGGLSLAEATDIELGGLEDRALLIARLCRVLAYGHDAEVFHGHISAPLIICNGGYPMLIDAPVGQTDESAAGTKVLRGGRGRASTDIRAIGCLLSSMTPDPTLNTAKARAPTLEDDLRRIASTAMAEEPHPRYVQVSKMEDELNAAILAPRSTHSATRLSWPAALGLVACLMLAAIACYVLLERTHQSEIAESQTRIASAEAEARTHAAEAKRLMDLWTKDLDTRSRVSDRLRYSDKYAITPDLLLGFSMTEQMRWPIGIDGSFIEYRLSFQRDRVGAARQFVDEAYARAEENNIEVMLTEVMLSTWEFEIGEIAAAADTLRRVVPRLKKICADTDPIAIGADQLLAYVSDLAQNNTSIAHQHYEDWVKRIIDIGVSAQTKVAGPYGEQFKYLSDRLNDEENYERDMEFTRAVMERRRARGLQVGPAPKGE